MYAAILFVMAENKIMAVNPMNSTETRCFEILTNIGFGGFHLSYHTKSDNVFLQYFSFFYFLLISLFS